MFCAELAPLYIKVERGQVSRVAPRPLKGAFMNITGYSKIDNKADYKYQLSEFGVDYVQFAANYPVGARFTVYLGAHALPWLCSWYTVHVGLSWTPRLHRAVRSKACLVPAIGQHAAYVYDSCLTKSICRTILKHTL